MAAPTTRAARADSQMFIAPPKHERPSQSPAGPRRRAATPSQGGRREDAMPGPSGPRSPPHLVRSDRNHVVNGLVVRSFRRCSISEYGSSTGYLLFTMYGGTGGEATQARAATSSPLGGIRPI